MVGSLVWPQQLRWEAAPMSTAGDAATASSGDPDALLVARCLTGDDTAWEALVRLHTRRIYSVCYRFTGSAEESQDLTQEVFLRVFRNLKRFNAGSGIFRVWLTSLARNLLIDHYRRTRKDKLVESIE
jgi:RNA polymerase sigma-70 factor (ECF subfamily)